MEEKETGKLDTELQDTEVPEKTGPEDTEKEETEGAGPVTPEDPAGGTGEAESSDEPASTGEAEFEDFLPGEDVPEEREARADRGRRSLPVISDAALLLLAATALAAVLASIAMAMRLQDTLWRVVMTLSLAVACVPMIPGILGFIRDRGRVPAELVMLVSSVLLSLCGGVVEAVIAVIIFDLLRAIIDAFTGHELGLVTRRLEEEHDRIEDEARRARIANQLREIRTVRLRPIVLERKFDFLVLLVMLGLGAILSLIPPLFDEMNFLKWLGRAAAALAVCAYSGDAGVLMTYLNAMDSCTSAGIFFAETGTMTAASEITSVLFSKTGTLTEGRFHVIGTDPVRISEKQLMFLAAYAGAWSEHPIDRAVRQYAGFLPDRSRVQRHQEREGYGALAQLDGQQIIAVGNIDLMEELGVRGDMYIPGETCVFVAVGRTCVGRIDFADDLRSDAVSTVNELRRQRVANVALMTGDNALNSTNIGRSLGISEVYSDCRPKDKLSRLQYILETQERDDRLAFIGSQREDTELMEMANISVVLGSNPDVTGTFPDVLLPSEKLIKLPLAISISRAVRRVVLINFLISTAVRVLAVILAAAGVLSLWSAATVMLLLEAGLFFNTRVPDER